MIAIVRILPAALHSMNDGYKLFYINDFTLFPLGPYRFIQLLLIFKLMCYWKQQACEKPENG